jgi:hypothetical protein
MKVFHGLRGGPEAAAAPAWLIKEAAALPRPARVRQLVGLIGMTPKDPARKNATYVSGDCCKSHFCMVAKRPPKGLSNFQK